MHWETKMLRFNDLTFHHLKFQDLIDVFISDFQHLIPVMDDWPLCYISLREG